MIKNPVSDHLPPGCPRMSTSFSATGEAVCPRSLVPEGPAAVVIGAFAHGAVNTSINGSLFTALGITYLWYQSLSSLGECGLYREDGVHQ